jgi:HEPN domain-containing protein
MEISNLCKLWLEFAADDYATANHMLTLYPLRLEIICYHCEQCAEKMLKGFLMANDIEPPKTHDLLDLCKRCSLFDSAFDGIAELCASLTPYAVQVRYPAEIDVEEEDMRKAIEDAKYIMDFISQKL